MKPAPPVTRRRIMPAILAQAPNPIPILVGAEMHHIPGADGPWARGRLDHQTAGVVNGISPTHQLLAGEDDPHTLATRGTPPSHLVGQIPPPRGLLEQFT